MPKSLRVGDFKISFMKKLILCISSVLILNNVFSQELTDIDKNSYKTVVIGTQTWMAENLKTTKYNDGTPIPFSTNNDNDNAKFIKSWKKYKEGAYCNYDDNKENGDQLGRLYNWYSVNTGKLCPLGWHVPSSDEWATLIFSVADPKHNAKSFASTKDWNTSKREFEVGNNQTENNSSGFNALPAGNRGFYGIFVDKGIASYFWTTEKTAAGYAYPTILRFDSKIFEVGHFKITAPVWYVASRTMNYNKEFGMSVRCLKD